MFCWITNISYATYLLRRNSEGISYRSSRTLGDFRMNRCRILPESSIFQRLLLFFPQRRVNIGKFVFIHPHLKSHSPATLLLVLHLCWPKAGILEQSMNLWKWPSKKRQGSWRWISGTIIMAFYVVS